MLVSVVPPRNDCGVRIVMHRHLVERDPFVLHVASNADFDENLLIHTSLRLPWWLEKLRKSRFGPSLRKWIRDYENLIWPLIRSRELERAVDQFRPDVILTLAEAGISEIAYKIAKRRKIPLAGLFLDWFPVMKAHYGHNWTKKILNSRYRKLYCECDVAICTSDGMKEMLGHHRNSHIVYPMPGRHIIPAPERRASPSKFRVVYVGAAEGFYGRMLLHLWHEIRQNAEYEFIIVGPFSDWPAADSLAAQSEGVALGFMHPDKAAEVLASADALLVVMSFEQEHELFMRTSFTTKFLDYAAFCKPIIMWGPAYCTPTRLAIQEDAAIVVSEPMPSSVVNALENLRDSPAIIRHYSLASRRLSSGVFNPERLQDVFVKAICSCVNA